MVPHNPLYRRTWMFPRNIRKIYPWKINQLVSIFSEYIGNADWSQEVQNQFSKKLSDSGLKNGNDLRDSRSGGARTYKSQLETLGLIYEKPNKEIYFTIAGEKIFNGEAPLQIMQELLMNYQYPSVYSQGANVKINPDIKVKPFHFTLLLLQNEKIQYLTNEEFSIPVIFGNQNNDLNFCIETILDLRSKKRTILEIIKKDKELAYTVRTKSRNPEDAYEDIKHIGNTLKNYLESCHLINYKIEDKNYTITAQGQFWIEKAKSNFNEFIKVNQSEESFQRAFGAIGKTKDTRKDKRDSESIKIDAQSEHIKRLLRKEINENPSNFAIKDFITKIIANYGFEQLKVEKIYNEYYFEFLDQFETTFLNLAVGGKETATEFEKTVTRLLNDIDGIEATHIGQKSRSATGGYTDILINFKGQNQIGLIDTKASSSYSMPSSDFSKITGNYIPNYGELENIKTLIFFAVIAGDCTPSIVKRLSECKEKTKTITSAINASAFLQLYKYMKTKEMSLDDFKKVFTSGANISTINLDEIIKK